MRLKHSIDKKTISEIILILFFLVGGITLLVYLNFYQLVILYVALLSIVCYYFRKEYAVFLFVFFLIFGPVIHTQYNLLGLLGIDEVVSLGAILYLYNVKTAPFRYLDKYKKLAIYFIVLVIWIEYYTFFKEVVFNLSDKTVAYLFKKPINYFLLLYPFIKIIKSIEYPNIEKMVKYGIYSGLITLFITVIFNKEIISLGFFAEGLIDLSSQYESYFRGAGLYMSGGDANAFGVFCMIAFGYFLARIEKENKIIKYLPVIIATFYGMLVSGSRTAMLSTGVIVTIFILRNYKKITLLKSSIFGIVLFVAFSSMIFAVLSRFYEESAYEHIDPYSEAGRVRKWIVYYEFMQSNSETFLFGNVKNINYDRAPHNYFVKITYEAGLLAFFAFSLIILRSFKFAFKNKSGLFMLYFLIPYLGGLMTVNTAMNGVYLFLFIALNYNDIKKQRLSENYIYYRQSNFRWQRKAIGLSPK